MRNFLLFHFPCRHGKPTVQGLLMLLSTGEAALRPRQPNPPVSISPSVYRTRSASPRARGQGTRGDPSFQMPSFKFPARSAIQPARKLQRLTWNCTGRQNQVSKRCSRDCTRERGLTERKGNASQRRTWRPLARKTCTNSTRAAEASQSCPSRRAPAPQLAPRALLTACFAAHHSAESSLKISG